ncbi:Protein phosphatase 2C (PP2C)-like domain [Macleaya cordata]|uniref:protein-serine/threonine phosphatase n=1 Tax=Macleaya cordata TaxID=56857 RepID=A0A200PUR5_MACCD|nr:Protein phosphatase 2C (PP2C)-like domain [Macleaya cordata]
MVSGRSEMNYSSTTDSMKMEEICIKKVRHARRKRLEIKRLKSIGSSEDLSSYGCHDENDYANSKMKMKLCNKVVTSRESDGTALEIDSKDDNSSNKVDDESMPLFSMSFGASKNDVGGGGGGPPPTVGIIVAGGSEICGEEELRSLQCVSHGSVSVCGRRREMEDAVTVVPGLVSDHKYDFFAVYDGHGGSGVANVCRDRLHRVLVKEIEERETSDHHKKRAQDDDDDDEMIDWENVMVSSFLKMDEEVNCRGIELDEDMKSIGSTAVVALVGRNKIIVANCGDSRAVLSRGGAAVPLSRDHRPDRTDEMERVEAAGGRVINWNGYRVLGVLATSRSIGDHYLKPYVISVPEVTITRRNESDEFMILASDGLWDVLSNEVACDVARRCLEGRIIRRFSSDTTTITTSSGSGSGSGSGVADAAAVLAELAMARGSKDNISVVIIELKKLNRQLAS